MVDIVQQIAHWRDGAREEWQVATELLEKGRIRHALFFTHRALEKALKAHVCRHTGDLAPRTHNLARLLEILFDPTHQEFEDSRRCVGPAFEPERFDLRRVKQQLGRW
jgi:HEPN domain-containing protein